MVPGHVHRWTYDKPSEPRNLPPIPQKSVLYIVFFGGERKRLSMDGDQFWRLACLPGRGHASLSLSHCLPLNPFIIIGRNPNLDH